MADTKISALPSGAPAQAGDEYVVARSGANYKLTLTNIAATMPPIGASTPNTGAFTTLSASGNFTLSGGTANGVLYLDGSKVATSGSALVFDGTNLGIGTASPVGKLDVSGTTFVRFLNSTAPTLDNDTHAGEALFIRSGGTSGSGNVQAVLAFGKADGSSLRSGAAIASIQTTADADQVGLSFYTSTSTASSQTMAEALRITAAGNVGIGTASPIYKLHVENNAASTTNIAVLNTSASSGAYAQVRVQGDSGIGYFGYAGSGNAAGGLYDADCVYLASESTAAALCIGTSGGSAPIRFFTNGSTAASERMRLDSSGNLGLGVTPSAWAASIKVLEMPNSGFLAFADVNGNISTNTFFDTSYKYKATGAAARYSQSSGSHAWYNAPSGTAGNAITFTQAMTLDASGNLGISTTSPGSLYSGANNLVVGGGSGSTGMTVYSGTTGTGRLFFADGTVGADAYRGWVEYGHTSNNLTFGTDGATRITVDSSGNVGVGNTPTSGFRLDLQAALAYQRIESTTGTNGVQSRMVNTGGTFYRGIDNSTGSNFGAAYCAALFHTGNYPMLFGTNNTERMRISAAGELLVGTTTVAGSSRITSSGNIAISGSGTGARLRNQTTTISVSTTATTIINGGDLGQLVIVNGDDGTNRFCDLVLSSTSVAPTVVQSFTALGTPAARTYSRSSTNLQLAMASGTYSVAALSLGF